MAKLTKNCRLPVFSALGLAIVAPAYAQDADNVGADPDTSATDIAAGSQNKIVVTAQRRQQLLEDVPLAIQAFEGEQLEQTGFRDLRDVISLVPGASEGRGNSAGIRSYQIRGVSSFLGDSTVGYYLDEAAYVIPNRNYAPVARSFDMERVEVLRGPQGTLYGLGAMGGTIRFITNDPVLDEFGARGNVGISDTGEGGNSNHYGDIALNAPIIKDKLAIRGVASYEKRGGFAESPSFPGRSNEVRMENFRVKLLAQPTERLTLKAAYHRNVTEDDLGQNFATNDPATFPGSRVEPGNRQVYDMYTGYVSYDTGPVLLESSTGYVDRVDRASIPIILPGPPGALPPQLDVIGISDSFVQEVRAVSQLDSPLDFVIGGIYQEAKNLEDINIRFGPPISAVSTFDSTSWAVFGEISYGFLDGRLRPLIGLRYFEDDRDFISQGRPPGPPGRPLPPALETQGNFDALNPRFNLTFEANPDVMFYTNIARGFRSGTFNNAAALQANQFVEPTVDPDKIWSYEVGTKINILDNLYVELIGYKFDWSEIQLTYTSNSGVSVIQNGGDVEGKGVEWTINWRPFTGFNLQNSGNFNSTEFVSIGNTEAFAATPNVALDQQLVNVPEFTTSTSATYITPSGIHNSDLFLNATYSYISEQGDFGDPLGRLGDDHHLLRARAGLQFDDFGVYLFGENLLADKDPIIIAFSGITRYYPRVIGLELSFDFR